MKTICKKHTGYYHHAAHDPDSMTDLEIILFYHFHKRRPKANEAVNSMLRIWTGALLLLASFMICVVAFLVAGDYKDLAIGLAFFLAAIGFYKGAFLYMPEARHYHKIRWALRDSSLFDH